MTEVNLPSLMDVIGATRESYYKLIILAGSSGSGKTPLLQRLSRDTNLPLFNLNLLLSERLLGLSRRQRALQVEGLALEIIDEHSRAGVCLDNTELLFDSTLRLNPLVFLQEASRNRLTVAGWNGTVSRGELRFGYLGHPDAFSQRTSGCPVISVTPDKLELSSTT